MKEYGRNYELPIDQFLTPHDIDLCARIVDMLLDGTDRSYKPIEIPAYIEEELGVPQKTTQSLAERLWRWLDEDDAKVCCWIYYSTGWKTDCGRFLSNFPEDLRGLGLRCAPARGPRLFLRRYDLGCKQRLRFGCLCHWCSLGSAPELWLCRLLGRCSLDSGQRLLLLCQILGT